MNRLTRSWTSIVLSSLLVLSPVLPFAVTDVHAAPSGTGTEEDPYIIDSCDDWVDISNNEVVYFSAYRYYEFMTDLDCSANTNDVILGDVSPFIGEFDGNGYSITIDIDRNANSTALFANLGDGASSADLRKLQVFGTVDVVGDFQDIGGFAGYADDFVTILNVESNVDVTASGSDNVGGIIGRVQGSSYLRESYYNGDVTGYDYVGGLVGLGIGDGLFDFEMIRSYSAGTVTGNDKVSGVMGRAEGSMTLNHNFTSTALSGVGSYVGGALGDIDVAGGASITSAFNFYDVDTSGIGANACATLDPGGGVISTDTADQCEGIDTGASPNYFYTEANEPFTVAASAVWNDPTADYVEWGFSGSDFPTLNIFVDQVAFTGSGSGTSGDPYVISTCAHFAEMDDSVEALKASYSLASDLDCSGVGNDVMVRGTAGTTDSKPGFIGEFDGNDYTVTVDIDTSAGTVDDTGLFGRVKNGGDISNLNIAGEVDGYNTVGALAGNVKSGTTVTNVSSSADVSGVSDSVGGLIGDGDGVTMTNSYSTGDVSGTDEVGGLMGEGDDDVIIGSYATGDVDGAEKTGGLVGNGEDLTITNSYATGDVTGSDYTGGLIGDSEDDEVTDSYATGNVDGSEDVGGLVGEGDGGEFTGVYATGNVDGDEDTGGLFGESSGDEINESYSSSTITSTSDNIGGLVGLADDTVVNRSYFSGSVTGDSNVGGIFGIVDSSSTEIYDSYSIGSVEATDDDAGGLVGEAYYDVYIRDSYAAGSVISADVDTGGGIVGYDDEDADVDYTFWDLEVTGQEESDGDNEIGLSTSEMKQRSTYTTSLGENAWDFDTVWTIDESTLSAANNGYPYLQWQDLDTGSSPSSSTGSVSIAVSTATDTETSTETETDVQPTSSTDFTFVDTPNHWGENFADKLKEKCDVYGYQNDLGQYLKTFGPDNPITRAELVRMLVACKKVDGLEFEQVFPDVNESDWFGIYVTYAYNQGWIEGYPDGEFKPNQEITRAEAIKIILLSHYSAEDVIGQEASFSDVDISAWYSEFVTFAESLGFVSGYTDENGEKTGEFKPENNITRAESAKIISLVLGL